MLASMYSAVAGLSVHQTKMDVIGNNIANVNTYGFKSSRICFSDIFYQNFSGASAPTASTGGTNPSQKGYGSTVSSIDVINARGGSATTDRTLDVYINGDGYLPVQDSAGNTLYTRLGTFYFDVEGNLVDGNGNRVLGLSMDENGVVQMDEDGTAASSDLIAITIEPERLKKLTSISIGTDGKITAIEEGDRQVTTTAGTSWIVGTQIDEDSNYSGALKVKKATATGTTVLNPNPEITINGLQDKATAVIDGIVDTNAGISIDSAKINGMAPGVYKFEYVTTPGNQWNVEKPDGSIENAITLADYGVGIIDVGGGGGFTLQNNDKIELTVRDFNTSVKGEMKLTDENHLTITYVDELGRNKTETIEYKTPGSNLGSDPAKLVFDIPGTDENGVFYKKEVTFEMALAELGKAQSVGTVSPESVEFETTVYNKAGQLQEIKGTWNAAAGGDTLVLGDMTLQLDIDKLAKMDFSKFDNTQIANVGSGDGTVVPIGQLSLATFINVDGLAQAGEGYYTLSANSGAATIVIPGNNGSGPLVSSALEMSNVDLAAEFTEMIFAQRGFQANSRVITTSDSLLEELVNLVR